MTTTYTTAKYNYHADGMLPTNHLAIWVFGSNMAGVHGAGAAKVAEDLFGAVRGRGEGVTGEAYAIPTKDDSIRTRPLHHVKASVDMFIAYARSNLHHTFFVTRIGCGLAGYKDEQIAPMFKGAPGNCDFPEEWREWVE
jgi:hypothetical protein